MKWLKTELSEGGKEFRHELIKIVATGLVALLSAVLLAQIRVVRDSLSTTILLSYWSLVFIVLGSATLTAFLAYVLAKKKIRRLATELLNLKDSATRDSLTNLYNANQIAPILGERIRQSVQNGETFSLIMVDIDNFKRINDTYTHNIGNLVLRQVAELLPGRSGGDNTFRFGGDEFLIASKSSGRPNEGYGFAERIRREIEGTQFLIEENSHRRERLTVSCGVTTCQASDTHEKMIARVSEALHLAKQPHEEDGVKRAKNFVYVRN